MSFGNLVIIKLLQLNECLWFEISQEKRNLIRKLIKGSWGSLKTEKESRIKIISRVLLRLCPQIRDLVKENFIKIFAQCLKFNSFPEIFINKSNFISMASPNPSSLAIFCTNINHKPRINVKILPQRKSRHHLILKLHLLEDKFCIQFKPTLIFHLHKIYVKQSNIK